MPEPRTTGFEVGKYICPKTEALVPLRLEAPRPAIAWPVHVVKCASCGEEHWIQQTDLRHPPVFGYE